MGEVYPRKQTIDWTLDDNWLNKRLIMMDLYPINEMKIMIMGDYWQNKQLIILDVCPWTQLNDLIMDNHATNDRSWWRFPHEIKCTMRPHLIIDERKKTDHVGCTYEKQKNDMIVEFNRWNKIVIKLDVNP